MVPLHESEKVTPFFEILYFRLLKNSHNILIMFEQYAFLPSARKTHCNKYANISFHGMSDAHFDELLFSVRPS